MLCTKACVQSTLNNAVKGVTHSPSKSGFDCLKSFQIKPKGELCVMHGGVSSAHPTQIKSGLGFLQLMLANGTCQGIVILGGAIRTRQLSGKLIAAEQSTLLPEPVFTTINLYHTKFV